MHVKNFGKTLVFLLAIYYSAPMLTSKLWPKKLSTPSTCTLFYIDYNKDG